MIKNKGSGAGGSKTTLNGLSFEMKTSIEGTLIDNGYKKYVLCKKSKYGYYYQYNKNDMTITYLTQSGFKLYCKKIYNIDVYKQPDEAFIISHDNKLYLKILEKKNQNVDGSVEDKLKTGLFNIKEYIKILNNKFITSYAFCISQFLQDKFESNNIKYNNMKDILNEDNIKIFYGCNSDYFDKILNWINDINI
jgi:hypothetical protein